MATSDKIDSIKPAPTEVNLLTSAWPLPDAKRDYDKWRNGLNGRNLGGLSGYSEAAICAPANRPVYDPSGEEECHEFFPLKSKLPHGLRGQNLDDEDEWEKEADTALAAKLPWLAARELWTGAKTGSDSLQGNTTAISTSSSGALLPIAAIAAALADYEACTQGGRAFIHVPSSLIGHLSAHGYLDRDGDRLYTAERHIVVPGPGYPNGAGAFGPYQADRPPRPGEDGYDESTYAADFAAYIASGETSAAGQVWIYVTGRVEAAEPHKLPTLVQHTDRLNEFLVTSQAVTFARFDTSCVFASLTTVPGDA